MTSHRSSRILVVLLGAVLSAACAPELPPAPSPPPPTIEQPRIAYPADEIAAALTTAAEPLGAITDQPDEQLEPGTVFGVTVAPCRTVADLLGGSSFDPDAIVPVEALLTQDMEVGAASDETPGVTAQVDVHHLPNPDEANAVLAQARTRFCSGGVTFVVSGIPVRGSPAVATFSTQVAASQVVEPLPGEEDRAIVVRTQLATDTDALADDVTHPVLHGEARLIVAHGSLVIDIAVLAAGAATEEESGRLADEATDRALDLVELFLVKLGH